MSHRPNPHTTGVMTAHPQAQLSVVMIGGTGAVGGAVVEALLQAPELKRLLLLGRRSVEVADERVVQHTVDVLDPDAYRHLIDDYDTAICALGVGEPSKVDRETFVRIDHDAALNFATACHAAGVDHFELLGSVGASASSRSFYLRTKGQLEEAIVALDFAQTSFFQPSMILTPTNRYGMSQALTLALWPKLAPILAGPLRKFRGIAVGSLGRTIALNARSRIPGVRRLRWDDFQSVLAADTHRDDAR